MSVHGVQPAPPGTDVGTALAEAELKLVREAANAAASAAHHVEDGEYEEAILAAQRLHLTIVKASACEQMRARFAGATTPLASNPTEGKSDG